MIEEWILLFKRVMTLCLALMLMAVAAFAVMPGAEAAEAETDVRDFLDAFPMKNISYKYNDDQSLRNGTVWFSQALLLQDSRDFSGEMAKASVAMAMAAYSESCVDDLLLNMGFTAAENTEVYDRSLNGLTAEDFDRVAYTIAYQDVVHPVTGETYRLYAVPVKGASANAEWFSDFNMGAGEVHEGFYKASMEVRTALETAFAADGMDADHRIVWFTGHSRGAACANLLAGWFSSGSQYTKAEHVFGYTFACPAVSTNADTALKNIYNFNNPGDLVPMLPLTQWGFGRNGQTIQLDTSDAQMSNVRLQFKNTFYANYAADTTDQQLQAMLLDVFGDNRQNFNCSRTQKLILDWVAYFMGGKSDVSVKEVLVKNGVEVSDTVGTFINDASLTGTMSRLNGAYSKYTELAQWAHDAYLRASDMTEAEFKSFLSGSHNKLAELKRETAVEFDSVDDFQTAENVLVQLNEEITSLLKPMESAKALVANDDGKVRDAVLHGHTQSTYTVWINSLYYGYRGWYNNPEVQSVTIDSSTLSIGNDCFCGCAELAELTLPDEQVALGRYSFGNCKGLRTVTLPVDYDFTTDPFRGYSSSEYTKGVTTIRYTYGQTGIMLDRSTSSNNAYYYERSLEGVSRNSLQTLVFADGITYIGNNLMYPGSSTLKTVEVPDSVTAIGERSFYGCSALTDAVLHEGLQTLGNHAFSNCSSLTSLTIPVSMQTIGSNAFSGCSSVVELTIPNTTVKMSNGCFANMKGLRTVTLPVDYDYTSNPFSASSGSDSTNGVTTIHYTYGQTGVMSDRVSSNTVASYNRTLEYASRNAIESIDFEDGITYVGSYLFYPGSASLNQITLPNSMQSIGNYAFYGCTALSSIDFNDVWAIMPLKAVNPSRLCRSSRSV